MKAFRTCAAALGIVVATAFSSLASADPLRLTLDDNAGNVANVTGTTSVNFTGMLGTGFWLINLTTGASANGSLGLMSVNVSSNMAGVPAHLTITLTNENNSLGAGSGIVNFLQSISGILATFPGHLITWSAAINAPSAIPDCFGSHSGGGAFSSSCNFNELADLADFDMTLVVDIFHLNDRSTTFTATGVATTRAVSEPGMLLLLGAGLIGLAVIRRPKQA